MSKKSKIIIENIVVILRKDKLIDDRKLAFEICAETFCSERKAKEYIKIARVLFAKEIN